MLQSLMPALTRYAEGGDIVAQEAKKEIEKLREALTAIYTLDQSASELMFIAKVQIIAANALTTEPSNAKDQ